MKPGLANAFLIAFIESMADFGNPMVLGGSHGVLSTEIFFAVVGAQNDPSRAAVLAIILLAFTLTAFFAQRLWLAGKQLRHGHRQGRCRARMQHFRGDSPIAVYALVAALGRVHRRRLCDDPVRRFREDLGPRQHADTPALRQGLLGRGRTLPGSPGRASPGTPSGRRWRSPSSRRRSRPPSASSPPT